MILTGFCKVKKDFRGSETRTGLTNLPIPERFHATAPRGHRPPAWKGSVLEIHTANVRRGHPLARHDAVRRPGPRPCVRAHPVGGEPAAVSGCEPAAVSGCEPASVSGGEPAAVSGGEPAAVSGGEPAAVSGGEPAAVSGGEPAAVSGGEPAAGGGGAGAPSGRPLAQAATPWRKLAQAQAAPEAAPGPLRRLPVGGQGHYARADCFTAGRCRQGLWWRWCLRRGGGEGSDWHTANSAYSASRTVDQIPPSERKGAGAFTVGVCRLVNPLEPA
jgi:hypothetical protein